MKLGFLYSLSNDYLVIQQKILDADGELTPELEAELDAVEGSLTDKIEARILMIRELERASFAAREEAGRLDALAGLRLRAATRIQDYVKRVMESLEIPLVETDRVRVKLHYNTRPRIWWDETAGQIPAEYLIEKKEIRPDLDLAYRAWKDGKLPEGFRWTLGTHLRIK